jgi:hypothetical protein
MLQLLRVSRGDGKPKCLKFSVVLELHDVLDLDISGLGWCDGAERCVLLGEISWFIAGNGCVQVGSCLALSL